jgi:hypothetical protein
MPLTKAAHYRAYAAASLTKAEEAADEGKRHIQLAIARHFCRLAEEEIERVERKRTLRSA